jgi:hypothetical protein
MVRGSNSCWSTRLLFGRHERDEARRTQPLDVVRHVVQSTHENPRHLPVPGSACVKRSRLLPAAHGPFHVVPPVKVRVAAPRSLGRRRRPPVNWPPERRAEPPRGGATRPPHERPAGGALEDKRASINTAGTGVNDTADANRPTILSPVEARRRRAHQLAWRTTTQTGIRAISKARRCGDLRGRVAPASCEHQKDGREVGAPR